MQYSLLSGHRSRQRHALSEPDMPVGSSQHVFPNLRERHRPPVFRRSGDCRIVPASAISGIVFQSGAVSQVVFKLLADGFARRAFAGITGVIRSRAHRVPARPCLDIGSAPRTVDQAHRNTRFGMDELAEPVSHGREHARGFGRAFHPAPGIDVVLLLEGDFVSDGQQPDVRIGRRGDLGLAVRRGIELPLHVRLPAAKPHVANHDVREAHGVCTTRNGHFTRGRVGCHGRKRRLPTSRAVGLHRDFGPGETDRHRFAVHGPAPYANRTFPLQNHVVAEEFRHRYFSLRRLPRHQKSQKRKDQTFHRCILIYSSIFTTNPPPGARCTVRGFEVSMRIVLRL